MTTFRQQVEVGPRDGSRYQLVIALVDTASTYAVMPSPMLSMRWGAIRIGTASWKDRTEEARSGPWRRFASRSEMRNALLSASSVSPIANRSWAPIPCRHSDWPATRHPTP